METIDSRVVDLKKKKNNNKKKALDLTIYGLFTISCCQHGALTVPRRLRQLAGTIHRVTKGITCRFSIQSFRPETH
jgi:hypothetical protein